MSGICGVLSYNENFTHPLAIRTMCDAIKHRGRDGIATWSDDKNIYLGQLLMYTTYATSLQNKILENTLEKKTVILDGRLDNREQLYEALKEELNFIPLSQISNSEIVLAAYQKWGQKCPDYLIGDFAFAIWDSSKQELFLARDHIGVCPLYYYYDTKHGFIFASEIKAILALPTVPKDLDEEYIAFYLSKYNDFRLYDGKTIYSSIKSLLPAHTILINKEELKQQFYWNPKIERFQHLKSDEDYIKAFRDTFIEAVRCRIDTPYRVGSHLSGGLDSSSVTCVARDILKEKNQNIYTFHHDLEMSECDEKEYAEAVINQGNCIHTYAKLSEYDFYEGASNVAIMSDLPNYFMVTPPAQLNCFKHAQQANCRIFLTGHEGDTVADYGLRYLEDALRNEEWDKFEQLLSENTTYALHYKFWDDLKDYTLKQKYDYIRHYRIAPILSEYWQQKLYKKQFRLIFSVKKSYKVFFKMAFKKIKAKVLAAKYPQQPYQSLLKQEILANTNVKQYLDTTPNDDHIKGVLPEEYLTHFKRMYCFGMTQFCELYDHTGIHHGLKMAHPFLDRRLMELSLVMPSRINFHKGLMRGSIREAMKDILPDKIRLRESKTGFSYHLLQTIRQERFRSFFDNYFNHINKWIDKDKLFARIELCNKPSTSLYDSTHLSLDVFRSLYFLIFLFTFKNSNQHANQESLEENLSETFT